MFRLLLHAIFHAYLVTASPASPNNDFVNAPKDELSEASCQAMQDDARDDESTFMQVHYKVASSASKDAASGKSDSHSDAFNQFQLFLQWQQDAEIFREYLQHRDQFLDWRQHQGHQPPNDVQGNYHGPNRGDRLFRGTGQIGMSLLSLLTSTKAGPAKAGQNPADDIKHAADGAKKSAEATVKGVEETVDDAEKRADGVIKGVEKTVDNAKKLVTDAPQNFVKNTDLGDYFLLSGLLLMVVIWIVDGFWGLFDYWSWFFGHLYTCIHNRFYGHPMPAPGNNYYQITLESNVTLAERGVAPPTSLLFRLLWDELTPGQQYVMGLAGLDAAKWDSAVRMRNKKPGLAFCEAIETKWRDLSKFQMQMLQYIGMDRDIWNQNDPECLQIHCKLWEDLSDFEKYGAVEVGIDGRTNADLWNKRTAPIFRQRYIDLSTEQQASLRKIRFLREHWRPYHDVEVPDIEDEIENAATGIINMLLRWRKFIFHWILLFWTILQLLWAGVILWKLKIFQAVWSAFSTYIVIGASVMLLLVLAYHVLKPVIIWVDEHVVAEIRVAVTHVKDVWAMIAKHLPRNVVAAVNEGCTGCGDAIQCHWGSAFTNCGKACHRLQPTACMTGCHNCCTCRGSPNQARDRKDASCLPWISGGATQKRKSNLSTTPAAASASKVRARTLLMSDIPVAALSNPGQQASQQGGFEEHRGLDLSNDPALATASLPAKTKVSTDAAEGLPSRMTEQGGTGVPAAPAVSA